MTPSAPGASPWLAIDTATDRASVALAVDGVITAELTWASRRRHTVDLAPTVERALSGAGVEVADLAGIAVAIGPGSYTGLRIGLALAKGLALPAGVPLVGVPTLHILAAALSPPWTSRAVPLWAVLSAGRGRVVAACYPPTADDRQWPAPGGLAVMTLAELGAAVVAPAWVAGELDADARRALAERDGLTVLPEPLCVRRAGWLAMLGRAAVERVGASAPGELAPVYLGGDP